MAVNDDLASRLHFARRFGGYMLLAGRIGVAGRCGGLGLRLAATSASEARIILAGISGAAARRRSNAAESVPMRVRTSMGLLLKSPPK